MRIHELHNGVKTHLTNEEAELLDKLSDFTAKDKLYPRELTIAQHLINKNAIKRHKQEGVIGFSPK